MVYDIDGTLTPGDDQIILEMALTAAKVDYDPNMRPGAVALCRAWAVKGYLPIYLRFLLSNIQQRSQIMVPKLFCSL